MVSMKSIDNKSIFVSPRKLPIGGESLRHGSKFCVVGVRASLVDSTESSSDFAKRMERAWLISQVTTCFAKSHPGTPAVLFVLERDQHTALIVREQAFVQSGWKSRLLFLSSIASAWFLNH
ncbi:DnaJ/Hsp40 cysteine-rich domain superfamily protein [Actinidia rufa]|uniref:DnaJ/Hsp40 cysteine-rich domain superfamily protein n=1 Tax=Actinidia rufa TaxID=165716 RepID=A0A7J0DT53_9ERIC|nr:DnaJ/Hsp40 cysteine-rich domain superfamily protein [Actinidia rufa]